MRPALLSLLAGALIASGPAARAHTSEPSVAHIEELVASGGGNRSAEVRERIWNTPLGLLMRDYLFASADPAVVSQRARRITARVYMSVQLTGARLTALQIMFTDMFERGVVDQKIQLRIDQLETEIAMKGHVILRTSTDHAMRLIPAFVVFGLLNGSPVLREQSVAALKTAFLKIGIKRELRPGHRLRAFDPEFIKSLPQEFRSDFSWIRAAKVASGSWASVAALDYVFQNGADDDSRLEELIINYFREAHAGLEEL